MLDLLIRAFSHVLIPMFLVGMIGSAIVVAITLVRDVHDFLSKERNDGTSSDTLA